MIISYFTPLSMWMLYLALNLPLIILGWFFVGKKFIAYSLVSVVGTTVLLGLIPEIQVTTEPLLSAAVGGILVGAGAGIQFKAGGSSGGFDIVGAIVSRFRDYSVGNIVILLNATVLAGVGYMTGDWNIALYSALSIYLMGKVMDIIYTNHAKVTVYVISENPDKLVSEIFEKLPPRGVTRLPAYGAFSGVQRDMIMTVTTKYELAELKEVVRSIDPKAFVNITETIEVMGYFRKSQSM
jgi:uncharacterized membrane-anchored protein YitT (DUF2179 family)